MSAKRKIIGMTLAMMIALVIGYVNPVSAKGKEESAEEQEISTKDLPTAVLMAFQKQYPEAKIKEVGKEVEDSVTYFEIDSMDGKTKRTVLYSADGILTEVEEIISAGELPDIIQASISETYPKGKIEKAEKVIKGEVTTFEVKIEYGEENIEAVYDLSGKLINSEKITEEGDND